MDLIGMRYELALSRIQEIPKERETEPRFCDYFARNAERLLETCGVPEGGGSACPSRADEDAGGMTDVTDDPLGHLLAALEREISCALFYALLGDKEAVLIRMELFLEVYAAFSMKWREDKGLPDPEHIRGKIRSYLEDYAEDEMARGLFGRAASGTFDAPADEAQKSEARRIGEEIDRAVSEAGRTSRSGIGVGISCSRACLPAACALSQELAEKGRKVYFLADTDSLFSPLYLKGSPADISLFLDERLAHEALQSYERVLYAHRQAVSTYACRVRLEKGIGERAPAEGNGLSVKQRDLLNRLYDAQAERLAAAIGTNRCCTSLLFSVN